jgi:hypothetical protein
MASFWDLDGKTRLERVSHLIDERASDTERWRNPLHAEGALDHSRSQRVAGIIPPGVSVLDLGCGAMALKQYLAPGCRYHPADLVPRSADSQVVDLNKGEFPVGQFDWITLLGVLEYVFDPLAVLKACRAAGSHLIIDYNSQWLDETDRRRRCGWVNDLKPGELVDMAIAADWKNIAVLKVVDNRYMFVMDCNVPRPPLELGLKALWQQSAPPA